MSSISAITWNTAGVFFPSIIADLDVGRGPLALYMSFISFTSALFLPIAGRIMGKMNARIVLPIFMAINGVGFILMSQFTSVYHFYFGAIVLGLGQSFFLFVGTPTLIARWFKKRAGFFTGLCMSFTAVGAIAFNPIAGWFISQVSWRAGYVFFGIMVIVIFVPIVAILLRNSPEEMGLKAYGDTGVDEIVSKMSTVGVTATQAVRSLPFWFCIPFLASIALYTDLNVYLPQFADQLGVGIVIVSLVGSASMLGTFIGKIFFGGLNDKTVQGTVILCAICGASGTAVILWLGPISPYALLVGAFLYGLCFSAATVQSPLIIRKIFGEKDFPQIYGWLMMFYSIASATGQSLWGFIADAQGGDYTISMICVMVLAVLFAVFAIAAYGSRKRFEHNK